MLRTSSLLSRLFRSDSLRRPVSSRRRLEFESLEERVVLSANPDTAWTFQQEAVKIFVLGNDTPATGLTVNSTTQGQHGSVAVNSDGSLTYNPAAGFTGTDTFNYTASDGSSAGVSVAVHARVASSWPEHYSAPYVDATGWPVFDFADAAADHGLNYFTLGFMQAGQQSGNVPAWGGYQTYEVNSNDWFETQMENQISSIRAHGGDVMVSFGGAAGVELAQAYTDVNALKAAYQTVIDAYQLTHIDFDIEGSASAEPASIDRRSRAISMLQQDAAAAGRELEVWYTLPVLPTGLTQDGINVLKSGLKYGVKIDGVNIMAMDYGDSAAPNPQNQMGEYAIQAAQSLFTQLKTLYGSTRTDEQLWHMVGVTPMIGVNDVNTEVFNQQDAQQLVTFAQQQGIGRLGHWSANRDQHDPTLTYLDLPHDSGISQTPLEFSLIFNQFTDDVQPHPTAGTDTTTVAQDGNILISVLANDQAGPGAPGPLGIASFTQGGHGAVTQVGNQLRYTPAAGYHGSDSFSYVLQDGSGQTATGMVSVTVTAATPTNHNPLTVSDQATTQVGQPVTINVLTNDSDPDGDTLSIATFTQPAHGTVSQNGGSLVYTPMAGYTGADSFTYGVSDGHGDSASATVSLTVSAAPPGNQPPVGTNDTATTTAGHSVAVNVLANDSDSDGDTLSIASFAQPAHGTVIRNGSQLVYTPAAGFSGSDSFTYNVSDGHGHTVPATVAVSVTAVTPPPGNSNGPGGTTGTGTQPASGGARVHLMRVKGRFQVWVQDMATGAMLQRLNLPQSIQGRPSMQQMDLNRDGVKDFLIQYKQSGLKRRLAVSGQTGALLRV